MAVTTLDFLQESLRFYMHDSTTPYTYTAETLQIALEQAIRFLSSKWNHRYQILYNSDTEVYDVWRNSTILTFAFEEPPVITQRDESIIVLQAAILLKTADIYSSTWDLGAWKDDEVSYSNIQGGKARDTSLSIDLALLADLLRFPLHPGKVTSMPGFHLPYNTTEGTI